MEIFKLALSEPTVKSSDSELKSGRELITFNNQNLVIIRTSDSEASRDWMDY